MGAVDVPERRCDLRTLHQLLESAHSGRGGMALVVGPAGIGKSTLLAETVQVNPDSLVLKARGAERESGFSYGVLRQLFETHLASLGPGGRDAVFRDAAGVARGLFDEPVEPARETSVDPVDAPANREALPLVHGLHRLVTKLSERTPLVLAIDDLHWCDVESLQFLSYLVGRVEEVRVVVIAAARTDPHHPNGRFVAELCTTPGVQVIEPMPLSNVGVAHMISCRLHTHGDEAFVEACREATGGNLFLFSELLRELDDNGVEPVAESIPRLSAIGPAGVDAWVKNRLRAAERNDAGKHAVRLVQALAVLGAPSELHLVARIAQVDWMNAADAADAARRLGILAQRTDADPIGIEAIGFAQPIVRRAVRNALETAERATLHREAAGALRHRGADPEAIAAHLLHTPSTDDLEVVELLRDAANAALDRGAPQAACDYLRRALAEPPRPEDLGVALTELGEALVMLGSADAALEVLRRAQRQSDDPLQVAALARKVAAVLVHDPTRGGEAVTVLVEASEALPADAPIGPLLEADIGTLDFVSLSARRTALGHVRRFDDPACLQLLAVEAMRTVLYEGPAERATALARKALAGGRLLEAETATSANFWLAALTLVYGHDLLGARIVIDQAMGNAERAGSRWGRALAACFRSRNRFLCGDLAGAEEDARLFLELAPESLAVGPAFLVDTLVEQGRYDEAEAALATQLPGSLNAAMYHFLVLSEGVLLMRTGHLRAGVDRLFDLAAGFRDWGTSTSGPIQWRTQTAEALLALGDLEHAAKLIDDEIRACRSFGVPSCLGNALRVAGLVAGAAGDTDEGATSIARACDLLASSPARLDHARALVDHGMLLRLGGHKTKAAEVLTDGLALARSCGAHALVDRADIELMATGARRRSRNAPGPVTLTASERRVADLAAAGRSNRQIAHELFVAVRTVETHLGNVYRKLDVHGRGELQTALAEGEST